MFTRRTSSLAAAALLALAAVVVAAPSGGAAPTLPQVPVSATVRADVLPAPQINGVVWKQVISGDLVFAGGSFSQARPFGSAGGGPRRSNLLAYSLSTGALTSFAPSLNGQVRDMAVTPDRTKLVVVGDFTSVNGAPRNRVAVFDLPSMALSRVVVPAPNAPVRGVAVTNSAIFFGGSFTTVGGVARNRVASVSTSTGALLPFAVPVDNGRVNSIVVGPDGLQVVLGGSFTSVGGLSRPQGYGLYRAQSTTGLPLPLPINALVRTAGNDSAIVRLSSDGTSFYGAAYTFGPGGNSEGVFQADWATGSVVTLDDCFGDSYDMAAVGAVYYVASHKHECSNSGGFPQTGTSVKEWTYWHSTAWTKAPAGVNGTGAEGEVGFPGTPRPQILPWTPRWTIGSFTGQNQATWTVTGNADYVVYGGEFTSVNGVRQQGIARFAVRSKAPNKSGPKAQLRTPFVPAATSAAPGAVRLTWPAAWDADDLTLSYRLLRNGVQVFETSQSNFEWTGRDMTFVDAGQTAGSKASYVVQAVDPDGNILSSKPMVTTVGSGVTTPTLPKPPAVPTLPGGAGGAGAAEDGGLIGGLGLRG